MTDTPAEPVREDDADGCAASGPREDHLSGRMYSRASVRFVEGEINHFTTLCNLRLR